MNYVAIVLDLIHRQEWAALELEKVATTKHKLFKVISEHIKKCDEFNGMTLLHAAVKYNPPMHILDAMIDAHSDALMGQDCVGRTPLHVACGTGADAEIIRLLVEAYPKLVTYKMKMEGCLCTSHVTSSVSCLRETRLNGRHPPSTSSGPSYRDLGDLFWWKMKTK